MHVIKDMPKVGTLIDTKEDGICFVLDIYDNFNFCAIDFETQNKTLYLTTSDIKEIIKVPSNVKFMWIKRMNNIMNKPLGGLK